MCGIAGYFNRNREVQNLSKIAAMVEMEKHRGPDDTGIFGIDFLNNCGMEISEAIDRTALKKFDGFFGFCRLSIQDLSANGHQPMVDDEKETVLVFNGEIYNADKYRKELKKKGYCFHSLTDTEVVLNLYKEYGFYSMIELLNGMFAIAIADLKRKKIYMARDRFGIKPFYYVMNEQVFMFASEIKSFLPVEDFDSELDISAVQEAIICGTNFGSSFFKNVKELQPGEIFEWDMINAPALTKYFDISAYRHPKRAGKSYKKYQLELKELLEKIVKSQMVSDVNIACQLSGGIDSSVISIIANKFGTNKLRDSVSIVFDEKHSGYDEKEYIDTVNKKLKLSAHQNKLNQDYYVANLKKAVWYLDTIPSFCNEIGILKLAETIAPHSTVLLSGEGADEIFGGYHKFAVGKVLNIYCRLPIKPGYKKASKRYFMDMGVKFENFILDSYGGTITKELAEKAFVNSEWKEVIGKRREVLQQLKGSSFERQQKYEILTRLPGLLNRQDKMTMAYSLENRVPFLDNEIFEYSYRIPEKFLLRVYWKGVGKKGIPVLQGKDILKKISSGIFGEKFSYRTKMGFDIPIREYLQDKKFKDYFYLELLPGMEKRHILNASVINRWYETIEDITEKELIVVWRCILTELWCSVFLDGKRNV